MHALISHSRPSVWLYHSIWKGVLAGVNLATLTSCDHTQTLKKFWKKGTRKSSAVEPSRVESLQGLLNHLDYFPPTRDSSFRYDSL